MSDKLIDTNILVYAYDTSEGKKHEISKSLLKQIWEAGGGIVCLQNLMEFFIVITKKVENPIDVSEARTIVEDILKSDNWKIVDRDVDTFLSAIDIVSEHDVYLWDAVIVACMKENQIKEIVTENKKDFKKNPGYKCYCSILKSRDKKYIREESHPLSSVRMYFLAFLAMS